MKPDNTIKLLSNCMRLIRDTKVCPDTPVTDWPRILLFAHAKGYLYTNRNGTAFALVFRIPEWDEKWTEIMPEKESGNKAYTVFAVSEEDDKVSLLRMFKSYVAQHNIEEMIYYRRNSDTDLKRIKIRKSHVKEKVA